MKLLPLSRRRKWAIAIVAALVLPTALLFFLNYQRKAAIRNFGSVGIPLVPRYPAAMEPAMAWLGIDTSNLPYLFWGLDPAAEIRIDDDKQPVTAESMARLAAAIDHLGGIRSVAISTRGGKIDGRALPPLGAITKLERLDLSGCNLGDEDLPGVAKIRTLRELNLDVNPAVSPKGVRCLAGLPRLRRLSLVSTNFRGDETLPTLKAMPALKEARLGGDYDPRVVRESKRIIEEELPGVTVWIYGRGNGIPEWDAPGDPL